MRVSLPYSKLVLIIRPRLPDLNANVKQTAVWALIVAREYVIEIEFASWAFTHFTISTYKRKGGNNCRRWTKVKNDDRFPIMD